MSETLLIRNFESCYHRSSCRVSEEEEESRRERGVVLVAKNCTSKIEAKRMLSNNQDSPAEFDELLTWKTL